MEDKVVRFIEDKMLEIQDEENKTIKKVSKMFANAIVDGGIIHLAALENDKAFLNELYYRAGGLVPFHKVDYLNLVVKGKRTYLEYQEFLKKYNHEFSKEMLDMYNIKANDIFLLVYNGKYEEILSGLTAEVIERGCKVVLLAASELIEQRWEKNDYFSKALKYMSYCINNHMSVKEYEEYRCQNVINCVIAQMITIELYQSLKDKRSLVNVFLSENIPGSDLHNKEIVRHYAGRWNS